MKSRRACKSAKIAEVNAGKIQPEDINDQMISDNLDTAGIPDPELIIRTSGEFRTSNFLMWQSAYSGILYYR